MRAPGAVERRALLDALAHAFRDNPMNVQIHGSDPRVRVRANRAGLRALVLDTENEAVARVITHGKRVVGGFIAVPPSGFPLPGPSIWRQIGCVVQQGRRAIDRWGQVSLSLGQIHPTTDHWYLAVLGVVPWLQGRGFGSRLLDELFRIAEDRPLYLESDRLASVEFYRARGFVDWAEAEFFDVRCWCLARGFPDEVRDLCDSVRED